MALATHLGRSMTHIYDIENRNRDPLSEEKILAAAKFLDAPAVPLLDAAARDNGEIALAVSDDDRRETAVALAAAWDGFTRSDLAEVRAVAERRRAA